MVNSKRMLYFATWFNHLVKCNKMTTEEKILEAARQVFVRRGMYGARMQEIADEAGINKALLHYYFRSKDQLFMDVFKSVFHEIFLKAGALLQSDAPIKEKIEKFIDSYMNIIAANPFVPQFIINEINRDPGIVQSMMNEVGFDPNAFPKLFNKEIEKTAFDIRHFIVSIVGMCIFPYAARPLIQSIYFQDNNEQYDEFLEHQKAFVSALILNFIGKN